MTDDTVAVIGGDNFELFLALIKRKLEKMILGIKAVKITNSDIAGLM